MLQPEKTFSSIRNRKSVKMTEVISSCININLHDKKKNEGTEFDKLKSDEINCFALMNEEVNDTQLKFVEKKLPTQTLRGYLEEPLERNSFKYDNRLFNTMKQNPKYVALWLVFWPLFDFVLVILLLFFYVPFLTFLGAFGIKTDFLTHSMGIIGLLCSLIVQTLYWHHQLLEMVVEYTKGSSKFLSNMKERLDNRFDWKTATHGSVRTIMDTVAKAILDQKQNPVPKQNKTPEVPNVNVKKEGIMKMAPFNVNLKAKYSSIDTDTETPQNQKGTLVLCFQCFQKHWDVNPQIFKTSFKWYNEAFHS